MGAMGREGGRGGAGNSHTDGHGLTRTNTDREAGAMGRGENSLKHTGARPVDGAGWGRWGEKGAEGERNSRTAGTAF